MFRNVFCNRMSSRMKSAGAGVLTAILLLPGLASAQQQQTTSHRPESRSPMAVFSDFPTATSLTANEKTVVHWESGANASGNKMIVIAQQMENGLYSLTSQFYNSGSGAWGQQTLIGSIDSPDNFDIALRNDGTAALVWQEDGSTDVQYKTYDPSTTTWSSSSVLMLAYGTVTSLQVEPLSSSYLVAFRNDEISARAVGFEWTPGSIVASVTQVSADIAASANEVSLSTNGTNAGVIAWKQTETGKTKMRASIFASSTFSSALSVSDSSGNASEIATGFITGYAVVGAYIAGASTSPNNKIEGRLYNLSTTSWVGAVSVALTSTPSNAATKHLAIASNVNSNKAMFVWTDEVSAKIVAKAATLGVAGFSAPATISNATQSITYHLAAGMQSNGNVVAAWKISGSNYPVYSNIWDSTSTSWLASSARIGDDSVRHTTDISVIASGSRAVVAIGSTLGSVVGVSSTEWSGSALQQSTYLTDHTERFIDDFAVATDRDGNSIAAWVTDFPSALMVSSKIGDVNLWTSPIEIAVHDSMHEIWDIVVDQFGNAVVLYTATDAGSADQLFAMTYRPGSGWSATPTPITSGTFNTDCVVASLNDSGQGVLFYRDAANDSLYLQEFSSVTGIVGTPTVVLSDPANGADCAMGNKIAIDSQGRYMSATRRIDPSSYAELMTVSGTWGSTPGALTRRSSAATAFPTVDFDLTSNSAGDVALVWEEHDQVTNNYSIYVSRGQMGGTLNSPVVFNTIASPSYPTTLDSLMQTSGRLIVAQGLYNGSGGAYELASRVLASGSTTPGSNMLIESGLTSSEAHLSERDGVAVLSTSNQSLIRRYELNVAGNSWGLPATVATDADSRFSFQSSTNGSAEIVGWGHDNYSHDVLKVVSRTRSSAATIFSTSFITVTPSRMMDTRNGTGGVAVGKVGNGINDAGAVLEFSVLGKGGLPASAGSIGAVSLNVTAANTTVGNEGGWVAVFPCGATPGVSNLNFVSGQITPNAVITPISSDGKVCFKVYGKADLIADINGYFTASTPI